MNYQDMENRIVDNQVTINSGAEGHSLEPEHPERALARKQIGNTIFLVRVHFSENSKETIQDKINRLLRDEVRTEVLAE